MSEPPARRPAERVVKERVDVLLVELGLVESRARAAARVLAGDVVVQEPGRGDRRVEKAGEKVVRGSSLRLKGDGLKWVSRGGLKLDAALSWFGVDPKGRTCLDVGASTGGFTDVLLTRGAAHVYAVDVGYGQLAEKLRQDPRVTSVERTHIKDLPPGHFKPVPDLGVVDVSFISLRLVLPHMAALLAERAQVVALIKPQFEVGRAHVGKGGVVKDEGARGEAVERVLAAARALGFTVHDVRKSPITGTDGNVELVASLSRGEPMGASA